MNFDINDTQLGKSSSGSERYDASLLFRVPRAENRVRYGIEAGALPFVGMDVWNCYEVSFLTHNGLPVSHMLKLIYSCENDYLVESKSLKLYLNSFNMERLGSTISEAENRFVSMVRSDLQQLLGTDVQVVLFGGDSEAAVPFSTMDFPQIISLIPEEQLFTTAFDRYNESPDVLQGVKTESPCSYAFRTDIMRSNCRVTHQPDWGDLFVSIRSGYKIDLLSVLTYIVSFRQENHFHEEVVEMIYKRLWDTFQPGGLMVAAMYTRRGGIDINPIRASHSDLLDAAYLSTEKRLEKTLRQ